MTEPRPKARRRDLLVQEIGEEVVVYDLLTHRCHTLDPATAVVFRLADGTRSLEEIAARAGTARSAEAAADATALAVDELAAAGLLEPEGAPASFDRRAALRRLAAAGLAAAALPAITSLAAPSPAMAQSTGASAVACVNERNIFQAARPTRQEAIDAVTALAQAWAQSVAAANGGTLVSYSVAAPARADLTPIDDPFPPDGVHYVGFVFVTGVCYSVP